MKKTAILLAALAAGAGLSAAEQQKSSYSVTTEYTYASEYIFRGVEQADASIQPSVEITSGDAYFGIWSNQPVTKRASNEFDIYGGYKYKFNNELSFEGVGTYYWYPEARGQETKQSYEVGLGATYTLKGIATSVYYYYDIRTETDTVQTSVGYSLPLEAIGSSVDFSVFYGFVDGRDVAPYATGRKQMQSYGYYGADANYNYKLNEKSSVVAGVHYAANKNLPAGTPDSNLWFTLGLSVGF